MKRKLIIGALMLLTLPVVAQSEIGQQEDFEDDTVGAAPSEDWYTFSVRSGSTSQVANTGLDGTTKALSISHNGIISQGTRFDINEPQQFSTMSFYWGCTATNQFTRFGVSDSSGRGIIGWGFEQRNDIGVSCHIDNRDDHFPCGGTQNLIFGNLGTSVLFIQLTFNWSAKTYEVNINEGAQVATKSFCNASADNLFRLDWFSGSSTWNFDQWQLDGGPVAEVEGEGEPSEFDSGLVAFATSAGFISRESQFFFALVLIGLATVTTSATSKWVAAGRFKNYLILGVQALVAVFCVIAAFLELWMFIVALMLGIFAVRGGSEIRNTFFQIRAALEAQNERQGMDMGPTGVMEFQVSEERQEAVERAFRRLEDEQAPEQPQPSDETPPEAATDAQEREE